MLQIARAGLWANDQLTKAYLACLPRKFIRAMAGFPKKGSFHLRRAEVLPSDSIRRQLWPEVDGWLERTERKRRGVAPSYAEGGLDQQDLSTSSFLHTLVELRDIFLQDAAVLQVKYPQSPLFQHPLFDTAEFKAFAAKVVEVDSVKETPLSIQITTAVPAIAEALRDTRDHIRVEVKAMGTELRESLTVVQTQLNDLLTGKVGLFFGAQPPPPRQAICSSTMDIPPSASAATYPALNPALAASLTASGLRTNAAGSSSSHTMSRSVNTIPDLWREWHHGVGGGPSIVSLDERFKKPCWRQSPAENMWYSRRKYLIRMIKARVTAGGAAETVVEELEEMRRRLGKELNAFIKHLKAQDKLRGSQEA